MVGALRVVLGFHLAALIPLTALAVATDALARVTLTELAVLAGVGAIGWLSYLAFYGALAIGPISVLSPIVSGYAAVTAVLAVVIDGNRLSPAETVAVAITIGGAMLASSDVRAIRTVHLERRSSLGFVLALCAMLLLGTFVFGVAYYRPRVGWLAPIFLARAFAAVFLLCHELRSRGAKAHTSSTGPDDPLPLAGGRRKLLGLMVLLGLLDTGGYVCFNLGVGHAATAIVAAASAPYALVPVAMGVSMLRERPTPAQWLGVGFVIAGVVALGVLA